MMSGMVEALLLISLALGYVVFYLANREEKALRNLGFFIGVFVMALSAVLIFNNLASGKFCGKMGGKGMMMKQRQMMPPTPIGK